MSQMARARHSPHPEGPGAADLLGASQEVEGACRGHVPEGVTPKTCRAGTDPGRPPAPPLPTECRDRRPHPGQAFSLQQDRSHLALPLPSLTLCLQVPGGGCSSLLPGPFPWGLCWPK